MSASPTLDLPPAAETAAELSMAVVGSVAVEEDEGVEEGCKTHQSFPTS